MAAHKNALTMISKVYIAAVLMILTQSALAANHKKFNELYSKYEECDKNNDYLGSVKYLEEALTTFIPIQYAVFQTLIMVYRMHIGT